MLILCGNVEQKKKSVGVWDEIYIVGDWDEPS